MSACLDLASIRSSSGVEVIPAFPHRSFDPAAISRLEGRAAVRFPQQLRLHPALDELGWGGVDELDDAARLKNQSVIDPILVTTSGTILAGFGRWRSALLDGLPEIHCIEYPLSEDESLQFILAHHQPRRRWNAFIRIRVALTLESYFEQKAHDNMRAGGKYKGSANLPEAHQIDVRQEIADLAGVGARNVSNVKTILQAAHPRLIEALRDGTLTINRAIQWCRQPRAQQLQEFTRYTLESATNKAIRQSIGRLKQDRRRSDAITVLDALQQREARQPGSVVVRVGRLQRTVVLVGRDLLDGGTLEAQAGET